MLHTAVLISLCAAIPILSKDASVSLGQVESDLGQSVLQYRARGTAASWDCLPQKQRDAGTLYQLQMNDKRYRLHNETIFDGQSVVITSENNSNQIKFHYSLENDSGGWTDLAGTMTASATVARDLKLLWIILLGLGGLGLLISGLGLSGRLPNWQVLITSIKLKRPSIPSSPGLNTKYCPNCGNPNPMEAEFCIHCGTNFPTGPFMEA
jgi:hypothetical protein